MDPNIKKELEGLKTAIASAETKFKEITATPKENGKITMEDCMAAMQYLHERVSNVYSYASRVESLIYNYADDHSAGHLPKIVGAGKMNKALKALGLDEDYQVDKKYIRASKDHIIVNYTTPLK